MIIRCLLENTTERPDIRAEHGLSLYIEACGRRILFDTGQSGAFAENADTMGVDLAAVDFAVLSHGHYDHGGGLHTFFARNPDAPIYANRHVFESHWHGPEKYIGLDPALKDTGRFHFTDDVFSPAPGLTLFSCRDRELLHPIESFGLQVKENGVLVPEDFRHEHYLLIEENGKRVLISGCSHRGILNIVRWFTPDLLIGGFHFSKIPAEGAGLLRLTAAARELAGYPTRYVTCHCTGKAQYEAMKPILKDRLSYLSAGQSLSF